MARSNLVEIVIGARDQASSVLTSLTAKLAGVATLVASYFGVSLFTSAVKGAADLEAGMSRVQAASGATAQEMEALKKAAVDAGATTKYTATEAASALETLSKSGLSAKDAITALPAVLNLAQAGDIALAQSADFVSKAVKGMGLEFSDAARVADVLAMGANASSTSVTGLAEAMSYTAPVARTAKLSLEETVAIIGKFADSGIDASRAGTALNSILSQFIDPASKFRQELAGAGIVTDNFNVALRQLAAAGSKGQQAILAVGLESGPALRALLNQGIGALDDLKAKLHQSGGSAAKAAEIMGGNLKGAFSSLSSAWDTVKIALGEPVLPVLTSAAKQLTEAISESVSNGTIGRFGTAIATAFQSAIQWVTGFASAVDFKALAAQLQDYATRTGELMTRLGQQATTAGDYFRLAYGVMSAGTNVVLSAVYALGGGFAGVLAGIQSGLALMYEGFAKITFGDLSRQYKEIAADIRLSADATTASAQAMGQKSQQAFDAAAAAGTMAQKAYRAIATSASEGIPAQNASAAAIGSVAVKLQEMAEANAKASAASAKQKEEVEKTTAAVTRLKIEYEAAMAAGDIQLAAQKQQQLRDELGKTKSQATITKDALQSAFESLGITSQAKLKESADAAQRLFDILKSSGQATALDLQNAFEVLAKRTLDAAGPVGSVARAAAQSTLEAKAAAQGLNIEFDAAGKTIVRAMGDSANAAKKLGDASTEAGQATETAAERAEKALDRLRQASEKAAEAERKRLNVDKEGFSLDNSGNRLVATESQDQLKERVTKKYGADFAEDKRAIDASNIQLQIDQIRAGGARGTNSFETTELLAKLAKLEKEIDKTKTESAKEKAEEKEKIKRETTQTETDKAKKITDEAEKRFAAVTSDLARNEAALAGQNTSSEKKIALNLEQLASVLELAKAEGNLAAIDRAQLALTTAKLASQRDLANMQRSEADALRTRAAQEESYAQTQKVLTPDKVAAVSALREKARQKDLEADRADTVTQREKDLATRKSAPAPAPASSSPTQLVRIDLSNGQKFEVNTASAVDAQQLNGLLRALEDAKRASGL